MAPHIRCLGTDGLEAKERLVAASHNEADSNASNINHAYLHVLMLGTYHSEGVDATGSKLLAYVCVDSDV